MTKKIFCLFLLLCFGLTNHAQELKSKTNTSFIDLKDSGLMLGDYEKLFTRELQLSNQFTFSKINSFEDQLGFVHEKYEQRLNGLKIEFSNYTLHAKNGKLVSASGELYNIKGLNTNPSLSSDQALLRAMNQIGAQEYMWDSPSAQILGYERPEGELVILPRVKNSSVFTRTRLVYKFDIYTANPLGRDYVYVDAHRGNIIFKNAIIHHVDAVGTATTRFSGDREIHADDNGTNFTLRDASRGNGVETYNLQNTFNYASAVDFTDNDNLWTAAEHNNAAKDDAALDAHWGASMTYDYFLNVHARNSFDGNGAAIRSYVHAGVDYVNAFWDGSQMTYGDGSGAIEPLTSIDIAAHEIGHAVTTFSANLVYQDEPGAMNEGISDVWGAAVEFWAAPEKSRWELGEDINLVIRSLENPKAYNQPDTYFGEHWAPLGGADNGGVHTNSGILNHWFYLLTEGSAGTDEINDNGDTFSITGLGIDKAEAIAYRLLTVYLSVNSQYMDGRNFGIQAAEDLYGADSPEAIATQDAWYAVGLGEKYVPCVASIGQTTLQSPADGATNVVAANLTWDEVTNAQSYNLEIATDAAFTNIVVSESLSSSTTSYSFGGYSALTTYYWRVAPFNACAPVVFTNEFSFTTANIVCNNATATDTPVTVADNTVTSEITFGDNLSIADVNVTLEIQHTWVGDLNIDLTSPNGTTRRLVSTQCGSTDNIDAVFDDAGVALVCNGSAPAISGTVMPEQAFSAFNGEESAGTWTLTVADTALFDTGAINNFSIEVCGDCVTTSVPQATLTAPGNGEEYVSAPMLMWDALSGIAVYNLQIATDDAFANIVVDENLAQTSYNFATFVPLTTYYWRVIPVNSCLTDPQYSETFNFTTANIVCDNYLASDTPLDIDQNGAPDPVESTVNVPESITVTSIEVTLDITHSWVSDLVIELTSPEGTTVELVNSQCGADQDITATFSDNGMPISCGGQPAISGIVLPAQPLAAFANENGVGDWTLSITDTFLGLDGGTLNTFDLKVCGIVDYDNDGILDTVDNCPFIPNSDQDDWDQDGIGNVCDDFTDIELDPADALTPNGDAYNDTWIVRNIQFYPNSQIQIFNRWGNKVLDVTGYQNDWRGESSEGGSGVLPAGSYYYVIYPNNPTFGSIGTTTLTGWTYLNY